MKYEGVLFDLDGTLIDTVPFWREAYRTSFEPFGVSLNEEQFLHIWQNSLRLFEALDYLGIDVLAEGEIRETRDAMYIKLLQGCQWKPSAKELLLHLSESKTPTAVVTSSYPHYVEVLVRCLHINELVGAIVAIPKATGLGKPNPYGLYEACKKLNVDASSCIYVGDQAMDVYAAKTANMTSCLIQELHTNPELKKEAHLVINDLSELFSVLK